MILVKTNHPCSRVGCHNTLCPLLYIALERAWDTKLEKAGACVLPEKDLNFISSGA
jgi:hypothetical protein